jgi:hypothetical protein
MSEFAIHRVVTRNDAPASENRIHSDDVARRYGFTGALVPGVTVFGHMTHPLVQQLGERWLGRATGEVRLLKPAYDGDLLEITTVPDPAAEGEGYIVSCHNADGVLLARLDTRIPARPLPPDPRWRTRPADANPPRVEIATANIHVDRPLAAIRQTVAAADNIQLADSLQDDLPIWRKPPGDIMATPLHPYWLARACNLAFVNAWSMPAWIHVGTAFTLHRPLRIAQAIEMRTIPIEVWQRKGHDFAKLYIAWVVDGEVAAEAWHTAIYKVAER